MVIVKKGVFLKHQQQCARVGTLPETNVAPGNMPSQKEIHLPTINFQVLLLLVSGRVTTDSWQDPLRRGQQFISAAAQSAQVTHQVA